MANPTLLDDLAAVIEKYVVMPSPEARDAAALWIAASHAVEAFQHAPRFVIGSPAKRCGTSRLLDVIAGTTHDPLMSINATVPAIFRSLDRSPPPTLLIDESDAIFGNSKSAEQHEDLRALLNAGHQRGRAALRCQGATQEPREFPTFAFAALAGIGRLPDTITDRAVNVAMRQRLPGEQVSTFRTRRDGPVLAAIRDRLAAWAQAAVPKLQEAEPDLPVEDRAADTWEPLVAVADLLGAGSDWPTRARDACKKLVAEAEEDDHDRDPDAQLLAHVRDVFERMNANFLTSRMLCDELCKLEDSPYNRIDLNAQTLANRLSKYRVKPRRNRAGDARGWRLDDLLDVFARNLPPSERQMSAERQKPSGPVNQPSTSETL